MNSRMRDTLCDRALLMHNIVVSIDPWGKDALFQRFLEYGEHYAKDRSQLQAMLDSDDEKQLLAQLVNNRGQTQCCSLRQISARPELVEGLQLRS